MKKHDEETANGEEVAESTSEAEADAALQDSDDEADGGGGQ